MMETTEAKFVDMLMDRLHGLEERVDKLQQENADIKLQLTISLHLDEALDNFSDGVGLWPYNFWNEEGCKLWYGSLLNDTCSRPLDDLHANATAFWGEKIFAPDFESSLIIGQVGERTTVGDMIGHLKEWWQQYALSHKKEDVTNLAELLDTNICGWDTECVNSRQVFMPKIIV